MKTFKKNPLLTMPNVSTDAEGIAIVGGGTFYSMNSNPNLTSNVETTRRYFFSSTIWQRKFRILNINQPELPDTSYVDEIISKVRNYLNTCEVFNYDTKLLQSNEPKIVIKEKASDYQREHFGESYTFRLQSLITGNKSQFIPMRDRAKYGITDQDKKNGGMFPEYIPTIANNISLVHHHYLDFLSRAYKYRANQFQEYLLQMELNGDEWWSIYSEYLQSPEWAEIRTARLEYDNHVCTLCDSDKNLQVHHLIYENVGNEQLDDLITVCKPCHQKLHPYKTI